MSIRQITNWTLWLIALSAGVVSWGQPQPTQELNKHSTLSLQVHTHSFVKNNEYFGPLAEGHTLAGYQLHPYLKYISPSTPGITTRLGLFVQRDWATTKFLSRILPTFTLQYQQGVTSFLIGTLKDTYQHQLLPPLYNAERALMQGPETGFRVYHAGKHTNVTLWLYWLTLLDKPQHIPEEFIAGISCEQSLVETDSFIFRLPLQVSLYHLGGQGIQVKDYSLWVGALGGDMEFSLSKSKFFRTLELEAYYIANQYLKQPHRPFLTGYAFYGRVSCQTAWINLQASYWSAHGFSSENLGHPLYQSIQLANKQVTYQEKSRHLAFLHVNYTYSFNKVLELVLHIDPYYDINHHLLEHEVGVYIKYFPCFELMDIQEPIIIEK